MDGNDLLVDAFGRIVGLVHDFGDLTAEALVASPANGTNTIGWLLWHTSRVQDSHVAELLGVDQLWVTAGFAEVLGRAPDASDTGYGQTAEEAAATQFEHVASLVAYHDAVANRTMTYVAGLGADDLDRVIDRSYQPPVTVGARLISVVSDSLQHLGQAAYARGLIES